MNYTDILPFIDTEKHKQAEALLSAGKNNSSPMIIKIIMGFGAWLAAISFTAFLYLAFSSFFKTAAALYIAVLLIALAVALHYLIKSANVFRDQLIMAFVFAGKISLILWIAYFFRDLESPNIIFAGLFGITAVSYPLFKNGIDRFAGVFVTILFAYLTTEVFGEAFFLWQIVPLRVFLALSIAGAAFIFYFRKSSLYPMAYAAVFASVMPDIIKNEGHSLVSLAIAAAGFFILCLIHLYRTEKLKTLNILSAFAGLAGLMLINLYVMAGIVFVLSGCNFRDLKLKVLGYISFIWGIIYFYMNLNTSLINKSAILILSGAVVLIAAELIKKETVK